jgi:hypothetical protein
MAQIDADERDYASLAALRNGNRAAPEAPRRTPAILQYGSLIGVVGSLVMRASEK